MANKCKDCGDVIGTGRFCKTCKDSDKTEDRNGYFTPECGHGEFDGGICDYCLLAMHAHETKEKKCDGCRQCLKGAEFDKRRGLLDDPWKISVRTERDRATLLKAFRKAGFAAAKDVFWHGYPGGAKYVGVTISVIGKDKVLESIMHQKRITPIAWTGV